MHFTYPKRVWVVAFIALAPVLFSVWATFKNWQIGLDTRWSMASTFLFFCGLGCRDCLRRCELSGELAQFLFRQRVEELFQHQAQGNHRHTTYGCWPSTVRRGYEVEGGNGYVLHYVGHLLCCTYTCSWWYECGGSRFTSILRSLGCGKKTAVAPTTLPSCVGSIGIQMQDLG